MTATLLAGPILRRATPNRVCVWLAAGQRSTLRLRITAQGGDFLGESDAADLPLHCTQLGENLFVYLLQARCRPEAKYPRDTLLYYRIYESAGTGQESEWDLSALAYGDLPYPSFFIPGKMRRLLHGSCRKPHGGETGRDALVFGDSLLNAAYRNLDERPALLLLTGDQIYADDVAVSLLAMLRRQAPALTGKRELLPAASGENGGIDPGAVLLHGRKDLLASHKSGFSSGNSENHLLSFGEYAAMYLYTLGNAQGWEPEYDWERLLAEGVADPAAAKRAFDAQRAALENFHATLGRVRRLLANIPTYMLFDDHDVTDDWNITCDWYDAVRDSPLGRRIVANALAAYWAFQGWGNDPDNYDKDLILSLTLHLADRGNSPEIGERFDLHTWKHRGWSFSVPTDPPIIAIDSRTQRMSTPDSYLPVLVDRYGLDWLRVEWAKLKTDQSIAPDACPIIIAAAPVLGVAVLETAQKFIHWLAERLESNNYIRYLESLLDQKGYLARKVIRLVDAEAWAGNKQSFSGLMSCLSRRMHIGQCVFLSGDVHYSFSADGEYRCGENVLNCRQLTASPLKNTLGEEQRKGASIANKLGDRSVTHRGALLPVNTWSLRVSLLTSVGTKTCVSDGCALGLVEFTDGRPVRHVLLRGGNDEVYALPPLKKGD